MNTQITEKLARSGRVLDVIAKVLAVICVIGAVFALFGAIAIVAIPEDFILSFLGDIKIESVVFDVSVAAQISNLVIPSIIGGLKITFILALAAGCAYCIVCAIILLILSALFKATAVNQTPFLEENVKRLKIIGIILIVASLFLGLGMTLIVAFAFLGLAYVFQYGTELQRAADETF